VLEGDPEPVRDGVITAPSAAVVVAAFDDPVLALGGADDVIEMVTP